MSDASTAIASEFERGIRYGVLAVFAVGVRRRNPGAVVNAAVALAATALPEFLETRFDVAFQPWQRVYAKSAMLTHAAGMLGPYDDVWWWDHLTHAHSATVLGGLVHASARRRGKDPRPRVLAAVVGGGALWELLEYAIHRTANRLGFEPLLVTYGKVDTVLDLVSNVLGALAVIAFGDRLVGTLTGGPEDRPARRDADDG